MKTQLWLKKVTDLKLINEDINKLDTVTDCYGRV